MATTTASRRASPPWRAPTCWCCSPMSTGSTTRRRRPARSAKLIPLVERITPEIEAMAGASGSELSRGGMTTKIEAGKIATTGGIHMVIASGRIDASAARDRRRRTLHLVSHARQSGHGAQEMDRRLARAEGHAHHRCRRGRGAAPRQQPAARRHHQGRGRVRARRCRDRARAGRRRDRPRACRLRRRGCGENSRQIVRATCC